MKNTNTKDSSTIFSREAIRSKVHEADTYLSQGLFNEARRTYASLLHQLKSHAKKDWPPTKRKKIPREVVYALEHRLNEIDRQFDAYYGQTKDPDTFNFSEPFEKESAFNMALALKGIGLYQEAIAGFRKADELGFNTAQCNEKIADCHLESGDFSGAVSTLQQVLENKDIGQPERTSLLQKMARAYEGAGKHKKAQKLRHRALHLESCRTGKGFSTRGLFFRRKLFEKLFVLVPKFPKSFFAGSLLFACLFMAFIPNIEIEDNVDFFFAMAGDKDQKIYEEIQDVFGNDEFVVVAFERQNLFTKDNLTVLKTITKDLGQLEEVRDITSLANVDDTIGEADYFEVRGFLDKIPDDDEELAWLKNQAVQNKLYVRNLISPDGKTAAIVIFTHDRPNDKKYRQRLLSKVNQKLQPYEAQGYQFYVTGWATINVKLSEFQQRDMKTFVPITYILISLTVFFFFRNIRLSLLAIVNISICTGATMGLFGLTGISMNAVTGIIQPLVMALALCDTVHIFSHLDKDILTESRDKQQALSRVLNKVALPCLLTSITTGIGFLSLSVSDLIAIREFAWIASAGMAFEFIFSFFLLPPLILLFKPETIYRDYRHGKGVTPLLSKIARFVQRRNLSVVLTTGIILLLALWYMSKVQVETNPLDYFKPNTPLRSSIDFVESKLAGVDTLDISIKADETDAFKNPKMLNIVNDIQQYAKSLQGVDNAISFVDFIKDMNESFHDENPRYYTIPESFQLISQYLLLYNSDDIDDFINYQYDHTRIALRISEHGTTGQKVLIRKLKAYTTKVDERHTDLKIRVTGRAVQHVNTVNAMVNGQIYSLALAGGVIAVIMFLALGSLSIGALSLIPNSFPIIINFGIMGVLGIPLNTGTALIAAVALGIAVDDSIHFLSEYKKKRTQRVSTNESVRHTIIVKGRAILTSSIVLSLGFGVLVLGSFVPVIQFGALTAVIMLTALIGDTIVLPSILLLKREKQTANTKGNRDSLPSSAQKRNRTKAQALHPRSDSHHRRTVQKDHAFMSTLQAFGIGSRETFMAEAFSRNIGLLTTSEQAKLADATIAIPGMGGVGGVHLITLIRMGVGKFHLADFDTFEPANINRQFGARIPDLGKSKLAVMTQEALEINPFLEIKGFPKGLSKENIDEFLTGVDVVIDALDFFEFDIRRLLFNRAREKGIYVITAGPLGFSSAMLIFSPHEGMSFDEYFGIKDDMSDQEKYLSYAIGLAPRATHIKYMDLSKVSLESKAGPSSSIACQVCSAMAATEALRIILKPGGVKAVPHYFQFDPYTRKFRNGKLRMGNQNPIQKIKKLLIKALLKRKQSRHL